MKSALIVSNLIKAIFVAALSCSQAAAFFSEPLLIQSLESKTPKDGPIFNEIVWFEFKDKDVWMMNQNQVGSNALPSQKDRVAVVIDKTKVPKTAYFMQLKPGPLIWSEDLYAQKIANRVSCFVCHANGLRTIRPDHQASPMKIWEMARLNYLNYKINSYGLVVEDDRHAKEDILLKIPFHERDSFENQALKVKTCVACHDGKIRGQLFRQHSFSIQFLVKNGLMPPKPEVLSSSEARKVQNFIRGL